MTLKEKKQFIYDTYWNLREIIDSCNWSQHYLQEIIEKVKHDRKAGYYNKLRSMRSGERYLTQKEEIFYTYCYFILQFRTKRFEAVLENGKKYVHDIYYPKGHDYFALQKSYMAGYSVWFRLQKDIRKGIGIQDARTLVTMFET